MRRSAAPMVVGMITAPLLWMFVIPVAYLLIHRRRWVAPARWFPSGRQAGGPIGRARQWCI